MKDYPPLREVNQNQIKSKQAKNTSNAYNWKMCQKMKD